MAKFLNPIPSSDPDDKEYQAFLVEKNLTMGKEPFNVKEVMALRLRAFGPQAN